MSIEVTESGLAALAEYALIPIAFEVRRVLDVSGQSNGLGGLLLTERAVDPPYIKDYDAISGEAPVQWTRRFDISKWGLFIARVAGHPVGACAIAFDTADVGLLEGRRDVALLWDIRVAPEKRGQGIGAALFRAAEAWAGARGCSRLIVETQNINVQACRFYARQACTLGAIRRLAYAQLPDEVQLLWYKELHPRQPSDASRDLE